MLTFGLDLTSDCSGYIVRDTKGIISSGQDIQGIQDFPMGDSRIKVMKNTEVSDGASDCMGMQFNAETIRIIDGCGITIVTYDPYRDEILWSEGFEAD